MKKQSSSSSNVFSSDSKMNEILQNRRKGLKTLITRLSSHYREELLGSRIALERLSSENIDSSYWNLLLEISIPSNLWICYLHWYALNYASKGEFDYLLDDIKFLIYKNFNSETEASLNEILFKLLDIHTKKNLTSFPSYKQNISFKYKLQTFSEDEILRRKRSVKEPVRRKGYKDKHPWSRKLRGHDPRERKWIMELNSQFYLKELQLFELSKEDLVLYESKIVSQESISFEDL